MWLPPPVPRWLPSTANVSVPSRLCLACSYSVVVSRDLLVPAGQRLDVDLDDAGVRGHRQGLQARVVRRAVTLQHHRRSPTARGRVSTAAISSTQGSSSSSGGRKTYSSPSRTSATSAVRRRAVGVDRPRPAACGRCRRHGSGGFGASGSRLRSRLRRHPGDRVQRQPQAGRRVAGQQHDPAAAQPPVGAAPADRRRPLARGRVVGVVGIGRLGSGRGQPVQRQHVGARLGDRLVQPCSSSSRASGLSVGPGRRRPARRPASGPAAPACPARPRRPAGPGWPAARRSATAVDEPPASVRIRRAVGAAAAARRPRRRLAHGSASSAGSDHSGTPSDRQCSAICQRGNGSPGYHLPWPRCTTPPGA